MILALGDSLTEGKPGTGYLSFIKNHEIRNEGLGGDTVKGLLRRVENHPEWMEYEEIILGIGTNDLLLPFLRNHSIPWFHAVNSMRSGGKVPAENREQFLGDYGKLLLVFKDKIRVVFGIPMLGEIAESPLNLQVEDYNGGIKSLCESKGIPFVDIETLMRKEYETLDIPSEYFVSKNPFIMSLDAPLTFSEKASASISSKRGLFLTTDGVHFNPRGAQLLAGEIQNYLPFP